MDKDIIISKILPLLSHFSQQWGNHLTTIAEISFKDNNILWEIYFNFEISGAIF